MSLSKRWKDATSARAWRAALALALMALVTAFAFVGVGPKTAWADSQEKHDEPVITHLVQENRDGIYRSIADWPQGTQFPFKVTGTLPDSLAKFSSFEYWLVAEPEPTLHYVSGTARVAVVHANGTETDVTSRVTIAEVGSSIVAGSANVKAAIPGLAADDELVLHYTCEYDPSYNLGFGHGNPSWAHAEYKATPMTSPIPAVRRTASFTRPAPATVQSVDPRSAGLTSTPEIKATVYCYALDIVKLGADTKEPLVGASFVLRDDGGLYYVKGHPWSDDASKATVMTTGANGKLLFTGLDHDTYYLEEIQAPSGYGKLGSIEITFDTTIPDEVESIKISSSTATIKNADSTTGTIGIELTDPREGAKPEGPGSDDPSGDKALHNGRVRPGIERGVLALMGDPLGITGLGLLAIAAALFVMAARRKLVRAAGKSGKLSGDGTSNGWEKGIGNE